MKRKQLQRAMARKIWAKLTRQLLAAAFLIGATSLAQAQTTDILQPQLPGELIVAAGVSDAGAVAITEEFPGEISFAEIWLPNNKLVPIPELGSTSASGISHNGQHVSLIVSLNGTNTAARFDLGSKSLVLLQYSGSYISFANAVANDGTVVGELIINGVSVPVYWDPEGGCHELLSPPELLGSGQAQAISDTSPHLMDAYTDRLPPGSAFYPFSGWTITLNGSAPLDLGLLFSAQYPNTAPGLGSVAADGTAVLIQAQNSTTSLWSSWVYIVQTGTLEEAVLAPALNAEFPNLALNCIGRWASRVVASGVAYNATPFRQDILLLDISNPSRALVVMDLSKMLARKGVAGGNTFVGDAKSGQTIFVAGTISLPSGGSAGYRVRK